MSSIPSPDDLIGERYRIVRLIGEGGMGAVFEAENVITHKRVALKWLHPTLAMRAESAQRLIREAQAASRIRHPNVVDVYDVITHNGTIMLVLELLDGEPLHAVIERGTMKVPEFIGLLLQAMHGVAAAHAHGVIHRDVHPGNIFLERSVHRREPLVKVLDFGISKVEGESTRALTQSGTTMGTPLYMSYEQLCAYRDLDARADIYSFGVILYRALTGHYPYAAESLTELAVQIVTTKPASVKALRREVPSALDRLVMACVSKERDHRPATVESLIDELEPFASEDSFRALLSGQSRQIPTLSPPHPITRLHANGASLIPPTAEAASTPAKARASAPSSDLPAESTARPKPTARRPAHPRRWHVPAAIGVVLLLGVVAATLLLPHFASNSATAAVAPPPALPESTQHGIAPAQPPNPALADQASSHDAGAQDAPRVAPGDETHTKITAPIGSGKSVTDAAVGTRKNPPAIKAPRPVPPPAPPAPSRYVLDAKDFK